jgi:fructosamine-3-kinase
LPRRALAQKLAKLHTTPAPVPAGFTLAQFGFPVTTCCGDTPQDNSYKESWADFFAHIRLRAILKRCENNHGEDAAFRDLVGMVISRVVPRLLGDLHLNKGNGVVPVVVHGDLWCGNAARGRIADGPIADVISDPAACYAHSEYELGMMRMFGGFGKAFLNEYHRLCPTTEPVGEYDDRITLYEL